jgi:signal transduction histidine kinase/DNA-binding NarL/FixJ family response regulator
VKHCRPTYKLFFLLLLAGCLLIPAYGFSQITKTARIELKDAREKFSIGSQIYLTQDLSQKLTEQVVATRHTNNLRGTRQESNIINLGLASPPSWLVFSVTNSSSTENWVLDFGSAMQGRYGMLRNFALFRQTESQIIRIASHDTGDGARSAQTIYKTALPVRIRQGATELFIAYVETANAAPGLIRPALLSNATYIRNQNALNIADTALKALLFILTGFFLTVSYMQRQPGYALFSVYYIGLLLFFSLIDAHAFASFGLQSALIFSLYPLSILAGLAATRFFLETGEESPAENTLFLGFGLFIAAATALAAFFPFQHSVMDDALMFVPSLLGMIIAGGIAFVQAQNGKYAGHHLALGWTIGAAGSLISGMTIAGIIPATAFGINAYWIFLAAQSFFFITGTAKRIQLLQQDERQHILRESRAAHSLAKLKQSKESADQARLMRVIERERELMVELREREIQRTEEMRLAKEAADEANKAKSNFLAVVSHEIRTPMTGIMGILRLLQDTRLNQEQRDYLMAIQKSGDTMVALLNDILDFEKIEKGVVTLEKIDFDLPKLVQGVVTLMSGHAVDKNVTLTYDIPENFPAFVKGDPARLRQVLLNLVNNAIKFTENGQVTIHLRATQLQSKPAAIKGDYEVYFAVEDTGIGISPQAQEKLFSPFEQADASITRKYGGTGLGLAISQRLIAAMGSSIHLISDIGKGSTFFFTLLMEEGNADLAEDHTQYKQPTQNKTGRMRVLVIEDNAINRKILEKFLEKEGHEVTAADSGEMALKICAEEGFDIVFTDINLSGGMSGLETARALRASPDKAVAGLPIIAVTGNITPKDIEDIDKAGINGFIRKPIPYEELLEILADVRKGNIMPQNREDMAAPVSRSDIMKEHEGEASDETINAGLLNGLQQSLGAQIGPLLKESMDKADEIIASFQDPDKITEINFMKDRAHELRGMAANFGMTALSELAARIENLAGQSDFEGALTEAAQLAQTGRQTRKALEGWLNGTE